MLSLDRLAQVQAALDTISRQQGQPPQDIGSPRANTDAGSAQGQAGFERRVAWLEEDVAVLHRRLRDECNEGGSNGDSGLRALVARLDGELSAERRTREAMEARLFQLEDSIHQERKEREMQFRGFSNELESTMRGLIGRIDEGLSAGALAERERADETEARLRLVIGRVDEGLSAGAAALQDTLTASGALQGPIAEMFEQLGKMPQPVDHPDRQPVKQNLHRITADSIDASSAENVRTPELRQPVGGQRCNAYSMSPSPSPSLVYTQTAQAAVSGLQASQARPAVASGFAQRAPINGPAQTIFNRR